MNPLEHPPFAPSATLKNHQFYASMLGDAALTALVGLLGEMSPGDRLPSERELTQQLQISRNTLRDRIGRLESMGILTRKERLGTFYSGMQAEQAGSVLILGLMFEQITFESLISMRHALERQAAIEACVNATDAHLAELRASSEDMNRTEDGRELLAADVAFHQALFASSNSPALLFFSQMLSAVLQGTLRHLTLEQDFETMRTVHGAVLDALEARDVDAVTRAIDAHFAWLHELRERERRAEGALE